MKKSVILTIAVIYILAIVAVGFLGIAMQVYNEKVYVEDIKILTEGYKEYTPSDDVYEAKKEQGIVGHIDKFFTKGLKVELKCQVEPENADENKVLYHYEKSNDYNLIINDDGTAIIEFYRGTVMVVTIQSADSEGFSKTIEIQVIDFGDL